MSWHEAIIFFAPIVTGALSLLASITIIRKVLKSETKFNSPYSRLVSAMSVYDVIMSLCNMVSSMPIPSENPDTWGAIGNKATCTIQGVLLNFSHIALPFYIFALSIYYFFVIKYSMTDNTFSTKIEPYLHAIPFLFALITSTVLLSTGSFGVTGLICHIKGDEHFYMLAFSNVPIISIFLGTTCVMFSITWSVWRQEKKMDQYRFEMNSNLSLSSGVSRSSSINSTSAQGTTSLRRVKKSRKTLKALKNQSLAFFAAFLVSHGPTYVVVFTAATDGDIMTSSYEVITFIASSLYPLQGVFNLCAHLDPMIRRIRREKGQISYYKAFFIAVKTYEIELDKRTANSTPRRVLADRSFRRRSRLLATVENV